jgi:hypothetical protein
MGEIRKINHFTGEDMGSVGHIDAKDIAGKPFICVYGEVAPRVTGNQTIVEKSLSGGVKAYVRFETTDKLNETIGAAGTFVATKENAEALGYDDIDILWGEAINTMLGYGISLKTMAQTIAAMMGMDAEVLPPSPADHMYVAHLNSHNGQLGAGIMAVPCMLEEIREKIGDFYLLPSSRHEIICVPDQIERPDIKSLKEIVKAGNAESVSAEDLLSEGVWYVDSEGLHEA